jgi:DNA-binding cell septation regulator SpoVG
MQLSEIRINLCGPTPPQTHPRIPQRQISNARIPQASSAGAMSSGQLSSGAVSSGAISSGAIPSGANSGGSDNSRGGRLRAFCSLTFDNTFVVRDVKLIEGNDGLFLAMPSRKLCDRCRRCSEKNHLRARFCNQCGARLDENRHMRSGHGNTRGLMRPKLHADIAHPINAACRLELERRVLMAYLEELERSKLPGYVAPNLDSDYSDYDETEHIEPLASASTIHLRRTGTE